jgi:uncharacterized protein
MTKPTIRILSIDGGGIRGIIPVMVLDALEKAIQKKMGDDARLADYFDFIAGTSIGGIIACALLTPEDENAHKSKYSAEDILGLFEKYGEEIFHNSWFSKLLKNKALHIIKDIVSGITDEAYSAKGLEKVLRKYFGKVTLDALRKPCVIPTYNTEQRRTFFFSKQKADINGKRSNFYVKDVCRATSAAPTVFEVARIESLSRVKFSMIDGGIFANNPSLCALAEVRKAKESPRVENILLVSLGTGSVRTPYYYDDIKNKPTIGMIPAIIDMMMSGVAETTDYQVRKMFDARNVAHQYFRIDAPNLTNEEAELDNATPRNIELLKSIGFQTAMNYDIDKIADLLIGIGEKEDTAKVTESYRLNFK